AGQEAELATRLGLRGAALAPLVVEGAAIGLLTVWSREARVFRIDELDLLKGLADQAAIAVDNARLLAVRRESEERYRQLAERSPDLVWVLDMDERFVYFNDRLMAFTGFEPEEFLGKKNIAIVHPSSLPAIDAWLDAVHAGIAGGRIDPAAEQHLRFALRHRDGHPVPVELRSIGIVTDGVQRGWQAAVRDVAELDRLERELRASETRYRTLTENSPDVIWALDLDDRFEYVSSRIEAFTGRPASEYEGLRLIDVLHEASRPAIVARFDQVRADIAAGRIDPAGERSYRFALEHADGSAVPVELRSIGIVVDGALRGWQGSVRDMREVERLERGLRESEERYRLLTERSPDLIVAVDADTRITFVSGRAEALIGWSPDELLGRNAAEIVHPDSVKDLEARWQERRRQPAVEQLQRVLVRHRDGRAVPVEMRSVGIVVDGKLLGEQSSLRDMTERDRMERELRRHAAELAASQERAHLAQELHDSVTQALFSMTLTTRSAEMLLSRDPAAAAQKLTELRELGKDALTEMRSLIFELRPGSLEQDGLVVALRKHAAAVQGRTGLPVVVEIDECPRLPLELEGALYRIAQEALHNVIKHARASQVRIELEQANHGVRMRIVDDGRGFDAARRPEGGHLGLAGMAARAERVGAILEVRSQVGEGTTIEVSAETDSLRDDGGDGTPVDPRAVGHGLAGADAAAAPDGIDAADGIAATDATDAPDPADSADARVAGGGV
ncbi:MAG TPA: PAS domain S-box protein, partial [Candidatus Limnocylindrales bacterium]